MTAPGPFANLLTAKLHQPPLPANRVARTHLVARLEEGWAAGRSLSLISAPAGYGKSALAAEWAGQTRCPSAWLLLDDGDNEPARFFLYLIAALQKVLPGFGAEIAITLAAGQTPPLEILAGLLAGDLARASGQILLFLDDFHCVHDAAVYNALQMLLTRQPGVLHPVLLTREDPAFPLARLRAQNQITEIRAADLRFGLAEMESFYRTVIPLNLSPADLSLLEKRTEGWAAGLQLAGLSMQGRSDLSAFIQSLNGSHRFILGYLTEEVLRRQSPEVQDFLLKTAVLKQLRGGLCDALTGRTDSAELLEELLAANLFLIPLDDTGQWYRYHPLFGELLFSLLKRSPGISIPGLHQQASAWYAANGQPLDAVDHSLAAGDYARATELLEDNILSLLGGGQFRRVDTWIREIPPEWLARSPKINLGFAWVYLLRSSFERVGFYLQQAQSALDGLTDATLAAPLRAECLALESNFLQTKGKVNEAIAAGKEALRLTDPANLRLRGLAGLALGGALRQAGKFDQAVETLQDAQRITRESRDFVTGMLAAGHLVLMALEYGKLRLAAETAERSLRWLEESPGAPPPIIGVIFSTLGMVGLERSQLETARETMERGLHLARYAGHNASIVSIQTNLARLHMTQGRLEQAGACLQEAREVFAAGAAGWLRPGLVARQALYELGCGRPAAAEALLREAGVLPDGPLSPPLLEPLLVWCRLLDLPAALDLAGRVAQAAETIGRSGIALGARLRQALLLDQRGERRGALDALRAALDLAEPEGFTQPFVEEGQPAARLLAELSAHRHTRAVLAAFPAPAATPQPAAQQPLPEPLTEREMEVLRLLAEGLSYAEAAERLVVSLNTVRYHVKGLYGKLGADRQTRAVEIARKLGLI